MQHLSGLCASSFRDFQFEPDQREISLGTANRSDRKRGDMAVSDNGAKRERL